MAFMLHVYCHRVLLILDSYWLRNAFVLQSCCGQVVLYKACSRIEFGLNACLCCFGVALCLHCNSSVFRVQWYCTRDGM